MIYHNFFVKKQNKMCFRVFLLIKSISIILTHFFYFNELKIKGNRGICIFK